MILQHTQGYVTVYGHNQRNLVSNGQRVRRGQQIAELGSTERASAPNLHSRFAATTIRQTPSPTCRHRSPTMG